ncbi:MAG: gamma-glutamylcyclotransferase [Armatimonadetes bacterium]|nr:gamma-glutamylcyclotransferase [Armatimonadota bacterium]
MRSEPLALFVYGTLKRGFPNHKRFCAGVVDVLPARVPGRLYVIPEGYPILEVPTELILRTGTADILGDVALQARIKPVPMEADAWVRGELLTFKDPEPRLIALDHLEDFRPGRKSLYVRVLVSVELDQAGGGWRTAWTYVHPDEPLKLTAWKSETWP